jgi:hypothetical protein
MTIFSDIDGLTLGDKDGEEDTLGDKDGDML